MRATQTTTSAPVTGCVEFASLFQDPFLEEPPNTSASAPDRRRHQLLTQRAESLCHACPLQRECLYDAVVKNDVSGYVAGTTRKERMQMRRLLEVTVEPEDFDTLAGVTGRHRQVDHDEVVRLRNANPHESLEMLAQRMGCSLSTVKRHLRKARRTVDVTPIRRSTPPSLARVMAAFRTVTRTPSPARRAA
ncbi:hypothetical protein GCM10009841_02710 [Microlunatus panaciterrae]|uniref:DNA-binding protein (UPF0251 family) n=1 Tax=Microlunatus panaciterrae TaxID=400768 RepID=A0ABS2RJB5_9ACTN|nr:WhiB family transcriptional regulator [Microlunatus panaciterrae]MBM7799067.1 putative DNA-binding protein (UPF0251 family) [Microlunatus panaciterrae]